MASVAGNSNPPLAPTGENNGPATRVTIWVLMSIASVFLGLRVYCKFLKKRGLWYDDYVLLAAWLALLGGVILTTVNISLGDGKHTSEIDPANVPSILLNGNLVASVSILAVVWSKTSFGITLLRIASGRVKAAVWFCIVTMNLFMGASVFITWFQCSPIEKGWMPFLPGTCLDHKVDAYYGVFSGAYSGVMDIILALLPWTIIWNLQMQKKEKLGVALAMSMGVFAGSTAFIKSRYVLLLLDGDFAFDGWRLEVWGTTEIAVTIVAASIPVLRVLLKEAKTSTMKRLESRGDHSFHSKGLGSDSMPRFHTMVTASNESLSEPKTSNFSRPATDKNMVGRSATMRARMSEGASILQTQELTIHYEDEKTARDLEMENKI